MKRISIKVGRALSLPFLFALLLTACQPTDNSSPTQTPEQIQRQKIVQKGRAIYMANCSSCHNSNPRLQGSIGPDIQGSSYELLEARILNANYPPGYTPKRKTSLMPALPELKNEIQALHLFLNN